MSTSSGRLPLQQRALQTQPVIDPKHILYKILHEAVKKGDLAVIRRLITELPVDSLTTTGQTMIMVAADHGHLPIVEFFVQNQAKINISDSNGWTALHFACRKNFYQIVRFLLLSGANVSAVDDVGNTALMVAGENGASEAMALVLRAGSDIHHRNNIGNTALMICAKNQHIIALKLLAAAGAGLDTRGGDGKTALKTAILHEDWKTVQQLIMLGARLDISDDSQDDLMYMQEFDKLYHGNLLNNDKDEIPKKSESNPKSSSDSLLWIAIQNGIDERLMKKEQELHNSMSNTIKVTIEQYIKQVTAREEISAKQNQTNLIQFSRAERQWREREAQLIQKIADLEKNSQDKLSELDIAEAEGIRSLNYKDEV